MSSRVALSLLVALLLVTAGCASLTGSPESDPRAERVVSNMSTAIDDVERYQYEGSIRMSATNGDETRTLSGRHNGSVSVVRQRAVNAVELQDQQQRSYVVGYRAYLPCDPRFATHDYFRQPLDESEAWRNYTTLGSVADRAVLERTTYVGTDTVGGDTTRVVVLHYDLSALEERQRALGGASGQLDPDTVRNATARVWVDDATHRPRRVELTVVASEGGATATATLDFQLEYPGGPLTVEGPLDSAVTDEQSPGCPAS